MKKLQPNVSIEEVLAVFDTDEASDSVAKRFGISTETVRDLWRTHFGEELYKARGKRVIAKASSQMRSKGDEKVCTFYQVPCSKCGIVTTVKLRKPPKRSFDKFLCDACKYDRSCPVCGLLVDGQGGIHLHFSHRRKAGDEAHMAYEKEQEEAHWASQVPVEDYVTCLECGYRGKTLAMHFTAVHGYTAEVYKSKFGQDVQIRSLKTDRALSLALSSRPCYGKGEKKIVKCSSCGKPWEGSKFLCPGIHDLRCENCKTKEEAAKEELRWRGKKEPEDYVECRLCGYRTDDNLCSHLQSVHPDILASEYFKMFPKAWMGSKRVMKDLTQKDLAPFEDKEGKIQVKLAAKVLGCGWATVARYCKRLGLPTRDKLAFQKQVLDELAQVLGSPYKWEWSDTKIRNPKTNWMFRFDGYFPAYNLLVEAHGEQHFKCIPYWHLDESGLKKLQDRDALKMKLALDSGYQYLVIRYNDHYSDPAYLKAKLEALGIRPHRGRAISR